MTTLADAIIKGSLSDVIREARANEHLNFIDEYGYTPLIETCIMDDIEKAKAVLECKLDVNFPDLIGHTALHWAVDNNNLELCELLLKKGADANSYSIAGMPVLVKPLLREQKALKELLIKHGAKLIFANDFINAKMLGHRFELKGYIDILNAKEEFVEISLEGFILEFTLETLRKSIVDYRYNFAARQWEREFVKLRTVMGALSRASTLIRLQHYNVDHEKHSDKITPIIEDDPLIIPIAQEGHAMTLIRAGNLLAVCDRATYEHQNPGEEKVKIYYMNKPWKLTAEYASELIYVRQIMDVFHKTLPVNLGLQEIASMPLRAQIAGNCSWANIEACIPTLFYMICMNNPGKSGERLAKDKSEAMALYHDWQRWDQERSLDYFISNFNKANKKRKGTIAEILCAVLFEACSADNKEDHERIKKIVPILKTKGFEYITDSYIKAYYHTQKTDAGENFMKMLKIGADVFDD
ncbi:MAG: ankyrin repeat domain-containing protein [Gammaproteobacteria bacterium]|nr:ankyrin repeat domain-containing protein [Gammaproteobacteria bacterium]